MLAELERHPHARAVLGPALEPAAQALARVPVLWAGRRRQARAARAIAAELLAAGSPDPAQRAGAGRCPAPTPI